jgi:hypothetical protein
MECVKAARFYHAPGINLLWRISDSANHESSQSFFDSLQSQASMPDNHVTPVTPLGNKSAGSGPA